MLSDVEHVPHTYVRASYFRDNAVLKVNAVFTVSMHVSSMPKACLFVVSSNPESLCL